MAAPAPGWPSRRRPTRRFGRTDPWRGQRKLQGAWQSKRRIARERIFAGVFAVRLGDLSGFVSSLTKRGLRFINIPTTLLAQVDASIGGKTGINSNMGKNLIGSFYQPKLVLSDTSLLNSLSHYYESSIELKNELIKSS